MPCKGRVQDREAANRYQREWYQRNKTKHKAAVKQWKAERQVWWQEFKENLICEQCGENHPACLEFHHNDPTKKEFNLGQDYRSYGMARMLKEIAKCTVLCVNCHRKVHWSE